MWRRTGARHVRWRVGGPLQGPYTRSSYVADDWASRLRPLSVSVVPRVRN